MGRGGESARNPWQAEWPHLKSSLCGLMSGYREICGVCGQHSAPSAALMRVSVMT